MKRARVVLTGYAALGAGLLAAALLRSAELALRAPMAVTNGAAPNDLLDKRDQLLADLSKEVRVTVVKQNTSYDVYIGNGLSLVVGGRAYELTNVASPTDPSRDKARG